MLLRWFPWRFIVTRLARSHGFVDPFRILNILQRFAQPSEVAYPTELVRAGVLFHSRGLMNTKAIQQNLDWVWPYWVCRQFNPHDTSFIPRGFSITHVNLSHRNWTAVGIPDCEAIPIVDPAGLIIPFFDGWSLDAWIIGDDGENYLPCQKNNCHQYYQMNHDSVIVVTESQQNGFYLHQEVETIIKDNKPVCEVRVRGKCDQSAWLVAALRPYNTEGISFVQRVEYEKEQAIWSIEKKPSVQFLTKPDRQVMSNYQNGDVCLNILQRQEEYKTTCDVGMTTAAALYPMKANEEQTYTIHIDLTHDKESQPTVPAKSPNHSWKTALEDHAELEFPDGKMKYIYDTAIRSLVMHSPNEIYPGPFTYKRFWFRDAAFILHALLCSNMVSRVERSLDTFPDKQTLKGYFLSQEGEWDSNGEALWIIKRYCDLTGKPVKKEWQKSIYKAAKWICNKRLPKNKGHLYDGLFPAGFSAEHLGNNDYYYWDDFWGVAGLHAAADLCATFRNNQTAEKFREEAHDFMQSIEQSIEKSAYIRIHPGLPASPLRRMDSGAIGSIIASYPLQLWPKNDQRILDTVNYFQNNCFVDGGFYQNMIHSGVNVYLTLQIAQVMLRAGDLQFGSLIKAVVDIASPTGQWPEAIHPITKFGCMGDGHHIWAAAEWVLMIRSLFIREEQNVLIIGSGLIDVWTPEGQKLKYGPTLTPFGKIKIYVEGLSDTIKISWDAEWRTTSHKIIVQLPGKKIVTLQPTDKTEVEINRY